MAKSSKDELRRLELEEQIAEATKRSTASLKDFADAQKKIVENYKIMQKINLQLKVVGEEIARLEKEDTAEAKEQLKILIQQKAALEQDLNLIKETNKELSKGKNLAKSVGNELLNWGKGLTSQFIPSLSDVFNTFLKLNDLAMQTSVSIGMSGEGMKLMTGNIEKAQSTWGDLGFDLESSAKIQQSLNEGTGRQVVLSQQAQETAALTARALNMQSDELGTLIGEMDQFGMGSELAMKSILDMRVQSEKMGVNSGKVIKKFQQNLELMNKLNFKDGVKGMQKMAMLSEKYKIEMSAVAAAADKAFNPEGAIEMAAKLQTLGGSLAGLGDPFQLMYKARNNPEKFMEDITMAAKQSAQFDPKSGDFKVSAYEMDRLRVAAEATGMSMEDLVRTAKQGAKMDYLGDMMKGMDLTPEQKDMLSGMAEITEGGQVLINGKKFSDMSRQDLVKLTERSTELKELAAQAQSSQAELQGIKNAIMIAFVNFFNENKDAIKGFLTGVKDFIIGVRNFFSPTGLVATTLALYFGPKVLWPIIQGRLFGRNAAAAFNAGTTGGGKKGFFGRMTDKVKGFFGKKSGAMSEQSTLPPDPQTGISNGGKGGGPGDVVNKGLDPSKMIKGAAAILIISAALFVFAKALQEFDKLKNGWNTLAIAGVALVGLTAGVLVLGKIMEKSSASLIEGATALAVMGLAFIPFAYGLSLLQDLNWETLAIAGVALLGLTAAVMGLGAIMMSGVGAAALILGAFALGIMSVALGLFGIGLSAVVEPLVIFVEAMAKLGPLGESLSLVGSSLWSLGGGLIGLSAGIIAFAFAWALGGWAFEGLSSSLEPISKIDSTGLKSSIDAINTVDTEKLDALKSLSMWMALLGGSTTIKFDESLKIDGTIELSGEGGGKSGTDWIKDPVFISKLKQAISDNTERERNGGRY